MSQQKQPFILMAEDDADDRLLVQDAFSEAQCKAQLRFASDGEDLMDQLLSRGKYVEKDSPRPDLILLDLNMPRKDGREALAEIRRHPDLRRIPVVVFTTSKADTDIARIYELGANSFITKPAAFDALVYAVKTISEYWFEVVVLPTATAISA